MRRCVWSRNLKNEEAVARIGPQRHREKNGHSTNLTTKLFSFHGALARVQAIAVLMNKIR